MTDRNDDDLTALPRKRGRKPIGAMRMTAAEAMRRSRENLAASGGKQYAVRLSSQYVHYVEGIAKAREVPPSTILKLLIQYAIDKLVFVPRLGPVLKYEVSDEDAALLAHLFEQEREGGLLPGKSEVKE